MQVNTLEAQQGVVTRLEGELQREQAKLEQLQTARQHYQERVRPYVQAAREAIEKAIPELQDWRRDFTQAVENFDTAAVGDLGVRLRDIEAELFPAIEKAVGAVYHEKRRELGIGRDYEDRLEAMGPCGRAASQMLKQIGGKDRRLSPFVDLSGETGQHFAQMILGYLKDQHVIIYNPQQGTSHFIG